jgi:Trk K+ transport system NAD-binding subunit
VAGLSLPQESRLISVTREGQSEIAIGSTKLLPGDRVLAILKPGREEEFRKALISRG